MCMTACVYSVIYSKQFLAFVLIVTFRNHFLNMLTCRNPHTQSSIYTQLRWDKWSSASTHHVFATAHAPRRVSHSLLCSASPTLSQFPFLKWQSLEHLLHSFTWVCAQGTDTGGRQLSQREGWHETRGRETREGTGAFAAPEIKLFLFRWLIVYNISSSTRSMPQLPPIGHSGIPSGKAGSQLNWHSVHLTGRGSEY